VVTLLIDGGPPQVLRTVLKLRGVRKEEVSLLWGKHRLFLFFFSSFHWGIRGVNLGFDF
jgi:hypothetical protein